MILLSISHFLERIGLKIVLYCITGEYPPASTVAKLPPEMTAVACDFLSPSEIEGLYNEPELKSLRGEISQWRDDDCFCLGVKLDEKIVAYVWCNLSRCNSDMAPFPLQKDEAFIFRARTLNAYRGKNLAPFLRYELYKRLSAMGRTKYYSISECFNAPGANLLKKLNAKPLKLRLYCGLFRKIKWNINLKNYQA
jgi:hypothetical protein